MQTTEHVKKRSGLLLITSMLIIAFSVLNFVLAYISLNAPADSSEFGALRNFSLGLMGVLIILFSVLSIIFALYLLKLKRWAFIMSIITLILLILLLAASDFKEILINISPGNALSLNAEILPAILIVCLLITTKEFWKK